MKDTQWVIAAVALAALVFVAVFAAQYLGSPVPQGPGPGPIPKRTGGMLNFAFKRGPETGPMEGEEKSKGWHDFFFLNPQDTDVKVGMKAKGCTCSSVAVFVVPGEGWSWIAGDALALLAAGGPAPPGTMSAHLGMISTQAAVLAALQQKAEPTELARKDQPASVPPGKAGWVRLRWATEKVGGKMLKAELWFDDPSGFPATLETATITHEALRVVPMLKMGTLTSEQLKEGVTRDILCWSSTRPNFTVEAEAARRRGGPESDPVVVGKPERLFGAALRLIAEEVARVDTSGAAGPVVSAYRIPVTVRAMSPDGKTPLDVGPLRRHVVIRCPELAGAEAKSVLVIGRVRGVVEIGNEEDEGLADLGSFPRTRGKKIPVSLSTRLEGMKLTFDRNKTAEFLDAAVPEKADVAGGRTTWSIRVMVKPNMASGPFPRADDPLYADSAVYFKAEAGGVTYPVRIGVTGTATE